MHSSTLRSALIATTLIAELAALSACAGGMRYDAMSPLAKPSVRQSPAGLPHREVAPSPTSERPQDNTESYADYGINDFTNPKEDPLSTFAIDVDTASYTISRRKLMERRLPPAAAVRVEEFVNFFDYDYAQPDGDVPFAVNFAAAPSPFDAARTFLRVGVQGEEVAKDERPPIHLVFLVDTSGSMQSRDKMGLLKQALNVLVENLRPDDTVALATYAGATTKVLDPTPVRDGATIRQAIARLHAGGSTAMADGLQLAYSMAYQNLQPGHLHRVIVCSDGDANVGPSGHEAILSTIKHYTQEGVTLSTIGFGMGNYKDTTMEQLANKGNGNYYYIDTLEEAQRIFGDKMAGTLQVIAKDVKIQVEFNPEVVAGYRLIGYENRDIADEDFRDDAVDAGEIGAGHRVTAIYELALRPEASGDPATVRIRHKTPEGGRATETTYAFTRRHMSTDFTEADRDFRMAVSVAAFAEILRRSPFAASWQLGEVRALAAAAARDDAHEQELLQLIDIAIGLTDARVDALRAH